MKLYLISQNKNSGYDTYDSAVVAAESEDDARTIHPSKFVTHVTDGKWMSTHTKGGEYNMDDHYNWIKYSQINHIDVKYLGDTELERGVVLASFNAG